MSQKIRIKLKSYDHQLVDKSAEKIVKAVKATGAIVSGPIPLPTHKRIFTVNRSTFVNKKAREQFQLSNFKRLIDIYSSSWMFFWIVLTPISIYRLWNELQKPKNRNISGIIESSLVLLASIIYIVIKVLK